MQSVLIVDDEAMARRELVEFFDWDALGMIVAGQARDGVQALEMIEQIKPDIVLIDIKMPRMDGIEVIVEAGRRGYGCSFIALSCYEEYQLVRQALKAGAVDYLLKHDYRDEQLASALRHASAVQLQRARRRELCRHVQQHVLRDFLSGQLMSSELEEWQRTEYFREEPCGVVMFRIHHKAVEEVRSSLQRMAEGSGAQVVVKAEADGVRAMAYWPEPKTEPSFRSQSKAFCLLLSDRWPVGTVSQTQLLFGPLVACYQQYLAKDATILSGEPYSSKIATVLQYMRQHYAEHITLEQAAATAGLSRVYLSQLFHKETKQNFSDVLNDIRLQSACHLLLTTDLKIYEIAADVGFNDASYFSAAFKKAFALSPYAFREQKEER